MCVLFPPMRLTNQMEVREKFLLMDSQEISKQIITHLLNSNQGNSVTVTRVT